MIATAPPAPVFSPEQVKPRTRRAILFLFVLAGITAEMLTGSTPVITYLTNPLSALTNLLIYGSGAILIREVVRRRGLGWTNILLLGAAYGIFEEGLVANTWANPWATAVCAMTSKGAVGLCDYGRYGAINWPWALSLTTFHAVVSITIPILLVELSFPHLAARLWLGRKAPFAFIGAEILVLAFGLFINIIAFAQHQVAGPYLGPYFVEIALMAVFIVLALSFTYKLPLISTYRPPRLWTLRLFGFFAIGLNTLIAAILKSRTIPPVELAVTSILFALEIWRVMTWSRRAGWDQRQRLALASGCLGFLLFVVDPILELSGTAAGNPTHGTALVALAYLIFLIILARLVARRQRAALALATS